MEELEGKAIVVLILMLPHLPVVLFVIPACAVRPGGGLHNGSCLIAAFVILLVVALLHVHLGALALRRNSTLTALLSSFLMLTGYCAAGYAAFLAFFNFDMHLY